MCIGEACWAKLLIIQKLGGSVNYYRLAGSTNPVGIGLAIEFLPDVGTALPSDRPKQLLRLNSKTIFTIMRLEFESNASGFPRVDVKSTESDDQARFAEFLNDGVKAAQSGDRQRARKLLMSAVNIDQHSENAWLWLASISEYPEELLVFLNNVLDINPENERALQWSTSTKILLSKTLVQRGIDANDDGRRDFAVQCFDQALSYDDRNVNAWLWLASLADSEERKIEHLRRVLAIDPDNETAKSAVSEAEADSRSSLLADAAKTVVSGDRESSNAILDRIEARWPDCEEAWVMRSHLAVSFEEKMSAWSRMLEIDPNNQYASAGLESLRSIMNSVPPPASDSKTFVAETVDFKVHDAADHWVDPNPSHELEPPVNEQASVQGFGDEQLAAADTVDESNEDTWNSGWSPEHLPHYEVAAYDYPTVDAFSATFTDFDAHNAETDHSNDEPASSDSETENYDVGASDDFSANSTHSSEAAVVEQRARILVVDDSPTARKLMAGKLAESGYEVVCAESGREAISFARQSPPSLVLVDIAMPKMDGYMVCRALRDEPSTMNVPVVMISGKDGFYEEERGNAAGASGFITKPFGPETLMKAVEGQLAAAPNK